MLLTGCMAAHRTAPSPAVPLRVMTYNIRSGNGDLARTADAIRAERPDIVALQEVDVHWAERSAFADQATSLGERLHMNVRFARIYDLPGAPGAPNRQFGVALLTRFPVVTFRNDTITRLSTQDSEPVPAPMPGLLEAEIDVHGRAVRVFDTHLDYRRDPRVRARQVAEMIAFADRDTLPTLVFGDMNATPAAPELQPLLARFRDAWNDSAGPGFTYPAEAPTERIDYVLVSRHFAVRGARVPDTQASDHRPVVVDLTMR
ncbi:MAG TPA: endonuclease/exonuclease/phosphatase family protein [Gemmatimonadaceae bacterium]|nr:endonuclease/exonuclease/phosphatase family protein [Gemmatimonadaceae bacterium]